MAKRPAEQFYAKIGPALKAKGPSPAVAPSVKVGDPCAGAKFEVVRLWSSGFSGAITPAIWLPHQTIAIGFSAASIARIATTRAFHATVGAAKNGAYRSVKFPHNIGE